MHAESCCIRLGDANVDENKMLEIVKAWKTNSTPEYRGFRCAKCQRHMRKAWHVWLDKGKYKLEVHFCDKCFKELER